MVTHHVVHEYFKNNISNNTHKIAQGGILFSEGANAPSRPPKCNPTYQKQNHKSFPINRITYLPRNFCSLQYGVIYTIFSQIVQKLSVRI